MYSHSATYPASVMKYRKLSLVFELLRFGKFDMVSLCVQKFFHKGDIRGLGEPTLLIQESQNTWGVVLQKDMCKY